MIINLEQLRQQAIVRFASPEFQDSDPRKPKPLSLEQQKKLAKELLRAAKNGEPDALGRFRAAGLPSVEPWQLADAQSVIAQENGLNKWAGFKSYIDRAALDPTALFFLVEAATPALPTMAVALSRHLQQLPSVANGLSLTEQLALQILNEKGAMNAARLFGWYTNHYEPLTFLGDIQFYEILDGLASAKSPALSISKSARSPVDWNVALTDIGSELLFNKHDWIGLNNVDRWVGGIHIVQGAKTWRIDSDLTPLFQ